MLKHIAVALVAAFFGSELEGQSPVNGDSAAVGGVVAEVYAAIARADTAALGRLLAPESRWVLGANGAAVNRTQLLAAAGRSSPLVALRYEIDSVSTTCTS